MAGVWEGWAPAFAGDTDESWRGIRIATVGGGCGLLPLAGDTDCYSVQRAGDTDCYSGRCAGTPLRRGY